MMRYGYTAQGVGISGAGILLCISGTLLLLALTVLTVILIVRIIKNRTPFDKNHYNPPVNKPLHPPLPGFHALEILNDRLAKGEISAEEYENIKSKILGQRYQA